MNTPKHSPGPWRLGRLGSDIYNADGVGVALAYRVTPNVSVDPVRKANARLITASPRMLQALQTAARLLDRGYDAEERRAALEEINGALAAATGEG